MAFAIIAGIAAAMPAVITAGAWAAFSWGAFALGAGLSMLSRALMPSLDMSSMQGATLNVREPSAPRKIIYGRTRVGGAIVFLDTSGDENKYLHLVIAVAGHEIQEYEKVFFGDRLVWSNGVYQGDWDDYAELNFHRGNQTTADANLVSRSSKWDSTNKLLDTAYVYVRLKYDATEYSAGLPNITFQVKGRKVYNPVTGLTAWTDNPALCLHDYLTDSKYGLSEAAARINSSYLSTAISVCDQSVALSAGGTEKRFTLNGVVDTSSSRKAIINGMLTAMGGKLVYSGDEYFISPAYYLAPTVSIDETVMTGDIQVNTKQSRRQLFNGVKGSFVSKEQNYIVADYPAQISSTYATADGDPIYLDMTLPFTVTNTAAQRLAKIGLLTSRQQTTATLPCNLAGLQFKAGDVISVSNAKMGWTNKAFEVLNYTLSPDTDGKITVNVNVIETAAALYDWNTSDEEDFLTGGEIDLYDGQTVPVPSSLSVGTATTINEDGTAVERLTITIGASPDVFVERYEVEWATPANAPFQTATTDGLTYEVQPVIAGATYYVRVRAVNNLGIKSSYLSANATASGDDTAPAAITGLTKTAVSSAVVLSWTNPSDADFSHVEIQQNTTGGSYEAVASVSGGKGEVATITIGNVVGGNNYYYKIRSVDYSGNASAYVYSGVVVPLSAETRAPRNAHGYVYFKTASVGRPSTPTATSYNYDTNVIGGLTSTWQQQPLTVTGGDGKYWSSAYVVTENAYDGTPTVAFSTAFSSFNFDGLVTFTNLGNTLSDPDTTNITTIDGGLIKTGKVKADRIEVDGVGLDTQNIGGVQTLVIGSGGVTNANIATNTITASRIAANAINNSEINTDAVENYNIENGAVTNVKFSGALSSLDFVSGSAGWQVDKNGDAEFNDATFRGTLSAASGTLGTITLPSNGNIKAGQTSYHSGTGFYLGNDSGTPRFSIGDSSGNHMRWNGSNLYIVGAKKVVSAGDEVLAVSTKGGQTNGTTYVKVAEIAVGVDGAIRTKATIAGGNSSTTAYGQFRKNGSSSAYKSFSKSNTGYTEFVDTSENINPGDTIELWLKSNVSGRIAFWGSFGVYASDGSDAAVTLEI